MPDEKITTAEIHERERFARDEMCKDMKTHYEKHNIERTGEQIEREVQKIAEDVERKKDHPIYRR